MYIRNNMNRDFIVTVPPRRVTGKNAKDQMAATSEARILIKPGQCEEIGDKEFKDLEKNNPAFKAYLDTRRITASKDPVGKPESLTDKSGDAKMPEDLQESVEDVTEGKVKLETKLEDTPMSSEESDSDEPASA